MGHKRSKNYRIMIAVLPDESSAFAAYRLLQCHGISPENLALVGRGYSSPDNVGLYAPAHTAWRYAKTFMLWLGILGVIVGTGLCFIFPIRLPNLSWPQILFTISSTTGLLGVFTGGVIGALYGWLYKSTLAISCRAYLNRGQYLLLLEGSESLTRKGRNILDGYTVKS